MWFLWLKVITFSDKMDPTRFLCEPCMWAGFYYPGLHFHLPWMPNKGYCLFYVVPSHPNEVCDIHWTLGTQAGGSVYSPLTYQHGVCSLKTGLASPPFHFPYESNCVDGKEAPDTPITYAAILHSVTPKEAPHCSLRSWTKYYKGPTSLPRAGVCGAPSHTGSAWPTVQVFHSLSGLGHAHRNLPVRPQAGSSSKFYLGLTSDPPTVPWDAWCLPSMIATRDYLLPLEIPRCS